MEERRKFMRFPAQLNVLYLSTNNKTWEKLSVINISREGMGFGMQESIQPGTILQTQVEIPPELNKIKLTGTVKWSSRIERNPAFRFTGGMQFSEIDKDAKAALLQHAYGVWYDRNQMINTSG